MSPLSKFFLLALLTSFLVFSACQKDSSPTVDEGTTGETDATLEPSAETNLSREEAQIMAEETAKEAQATYTSAVENEDSSQCSAIESSDLRFSCEQSILFNSAVENGNKSDCQKLTAEESIKECKRQIP